MAVRSFRFEQPFALFESLRLHRFGPHDPTFRPTRDAVWRAQHTPEGVGALHIRRRDPFGFDARGYGPGGAFLLDRAEAWLAVDDAPDGFSPEHPELARIAARLRGFRLARTPTLFEVFVSVVLQQRVSWREAARSFSRIVRAHGTPVPGTDAVLAMPPVSFWKHLALEGYRAFDVDGRRARVLKAGATSSRRLEETFSMDLEAAEHRLRAFSGVGPWTASYVLGFAHGHPDVVPLGDYDLPRLVSNVLAGEPRGDDDLMLRLLEPFRGHRFRVIRLIQESGSPTPRFGPRRPTSSFRRRG